VRVCVSRMAGPELQAGLTSFTTLRKVGFNVALSFLHLVHTQRSSPDPESLLLHLHVGMDIAAGAVPLNGSGNRPSQLR
jgi:hypothetical protein